MIRDKWLDREGGESRVVIQGIDWPAEMSLQQAHEILADLEGALQPVEQRRLVAALAELWLATAKASIGEAEMEAKARVYARDLQAWPADVVLAVLQEARRRCKWFPSVAELAELCEQKSNLRTWLYRSLLDRIAQLERPAPPSLPRVTEGSQQSRPGHVSWAPSTGNLELLAGALSITREQAFARVLNASDEELVQLEATVRHMRAERDAETADGAPGTPTS